VLLQKNPISFVEIYSDTFLWMPLTSFSTTNPFKLAGGDEERHRERKPRGKKKKKKEKMADFTVTFATFISSFCA
jgi:hypothetical protein